MRIRRRICEGRSYDAKIRPQGTRGEVRSTLGELALGELDKNGRSLYAYPQNNMLDIYSDVNALRLCNT